MTELFDFYRERLQNMLAAGTPVAVAAEQAQLDTETQFRGERVYVTPNPRLRARQIARLGQMKLRDMAVATGMPVRTIARIRNGR